MKRNRKRCYHWVIAGVALLVMFVQLGIVNNLVGLYIVRSPSPWGSPGADVRVDPAAGDGALRLSSQRYLYRYLSCIC